MEVIDCRGHLFTIFQVTKCSQLQFNKSFKNCDFQISVQIKGHQFPNKLSDKWIKIKILDNKAIFR